jgi:hypothetical protein
MKPTALICDVDNTILHTLPRVKSCLEAIGRPEVFEKGRHSYGGFKEYLSETEVDQFFQIFLSNQFLMEDTPMEDASNVLNKWAEKHHLIYVTGRHDVKGDSMRESTLEWLKAHGYPIPDGERVQLHMKPERYMVDVDFKQQALMKIQEQYHLCAGLGDLPYEGKLYGSLGLKPLILAVAGMFSEAELKASHTDVKVIHHWNEVPEQLSIVCQE